MSINEAIFNKKKSIETIDSSELSSDISDKSLDYYLSEKHKSMSNQNTNNNIQSNTGELDPTPKINTKRPRFYSENIERKALYGNETYNELKVQKINKCLKKIAKTDLLNSNSRKFTFS